MSPVNESKYLMSHVKRDGVVMAHGRGSEIWDEAGKRYLDFVQGWAANALGHAPAVVTRALIEQSQRLLTSSPAYHNRGELVLAERLCAISGLGHATFLSSGAEAVETAIKICRKWGKLNKPGAFEVLSAENAFHGRTLAAMALSGKPGWSDMFPPRVDGFRKIGYGDLSAMRAAIGPRTVAICVEPVQGEAGAVSPGIDYLKGLKSLCDEHRLLLVFDEIQTGMGRTGTWFAFQQAGVLPDVVTLGKGLGAGLPLSCVLVHERANVFAPGEHGGTFAGSALQMAVGNAVLDAMSEPHFFPTVLARAALLRAGLVALAAQFGGTARGQGLLLAWVLPVPVADAIRIRCQELGLLLNAARPNVLRFMPELQVPEAAIAEMLELLTQATAEILQDRSLSATVTATRANAGASSQ